MTPLNPQNVLTNIDGFVNMKNEKIPEKKADIQKIAGDIINNINEIYKNKRILVPQQVVFLGAMLIKLHNLKAEIKHDPEVIRLYDAIFQIIRNDPRFNKAMQNNLDLAPDVFENLLSLVETDISEEIIGQERLPEALVRQISATMIKEQPSLKAKAKDISKVADTLYPFVILSATLHPQAKVPTKEVEKRAVIDDTETFIKECRSQFGINANRETILRGNDFFEKCLLLTWNYARSKKL